MNFLVSNEEIKQVLERKKNNEDQGRCPSCGEVNPSNASFCAGCGVDLHLPSKKIGDIIKLLGLSSAESMYLLNPKTDINEMINSTFLDMLNRNILEITSHEVIKGVLLKNEKLETFVQQGSAFNEVLKPHEEAFQEAMQLKPELTLKQYTKNLIKKLGRFRWHRKGSRYVWNFTVYRNKIRDQLEDIGYLEKIKTKSLGFIPKSHYQLTDYGEENKNKIESFLLTDEYNEEYQQKHMLPALDTRMFVLNDDEMIKVQNFSGIFHGEIVSRIHQSSL